MQGGHWSGKSQGNLIFLQGQGILQIGQGNFKYQESQGKVREFHNFGQNMCCSRYFDYLKSSGGSRGGSLEPRFETNLFHFHGEMYKNLGKLIKSNPP